jgi:hypothetical protein
MRQLLFILCILEVLLATWLINTTGMYLSVLLFNAVSLSIAFVWLRVASLPPVTVAPTAIPACIRPAIQWLLFGGLSWYIITKLRHLWWHQLTYPNPTGGSSDIIPQIQTLVTRFITHQPPYQLIHFSNYNLYPTYLPMQWLPYIATEWLHKDYRWIPTLSLLAVCGYFFWRTRKLPGWWGQVVPVWPLVAWCACILNDNNLYIFCVEGLIAAYYFFTAISITGRSIWPLAVGVGLCLLSRYSIIFWVPLAFTLLLMAGQRKNAWTLVLVSVAFFMACYWWPFLRTDGGIFLKGYLYHTHAALGEWQRDLAIHNGSANLRNGLGFTSFALALLPGTLENVLTTYRILHFALCCGTVIALGAYFYRHRHIPVQQYMLFSLKVYLTVFYAFIQIPYKYLFLVPIMVSCALLGSMFTSAPANQTK